MRLVLPLVLALAVLGAAPASTPLPRGDGGFRLGMSRAQVDSLVTARQVTVISSGESFLVSESQDPGIEYEQYSFYAMPHGAALLWRVTVGYRLTASPQDFAAVRVTLSERLGEPVSRSGETVDPAGGFGERPAPVAAQASWADAATTVQLGARWTDAPDRRAERMLVTWTDRRLQRLAEARRKRPAGGGASESN